MNADRLTEIRHIAPTAGPLGQKAINELLAENGRLGRLLAGARVRGDQLERNWENLVGPLIDILSPDDPEELTGEQPSLIIEAARELAAEATRLRDVETEALDATNGFLDLVSDNNRLTAELEELRRNGAGTVQQLRAELEAAMRDRDAYLRIAATQSQAAADACDRLGIAESDDESTPVAIAKIADLAEQLRAELADLHNVEADLRAQVASLTRERNHPYGEPVKARMLTRKDCCGAPWDGTHRSGCEEAK